MQKLPELLILNGELAGRRLTVSSGGLRVGRSSQNDVAVPDEEMSRNHCLLSLDGDALTITDLASANGTAVNGENIGAEVCRLKPGDVIEIGTTRIRVVGGREPDPVSVPVAVSAPAIGAGEVDLGLEAPMVPPEDSSGEAEKPRRKTLINVLWGVTAFLLVATAVIILNGTGDGDAASEEGSRHSVAVKPATSATKIVSVAFEKVDADAKRVFSYRMTLDASGLLHVGSDDMPVANRHVDKRVKLGAEALVRVADIFGRTDFFKLDDAYQGPSAQDENALSYRRIRVVTGDGLVKDVLVENMLEPDAFKALRERLEAFSMNELGIRAIQYSREELLKLSEGAARVAAAKWEEREVEYGNLAAAVKAYREAIVYLETVNPKPEGYAKLKERLKTCEEELSRRYKDQRFIAERAIKLEDWETARRELRKLCDMVPDKGDDRHDEANAKLLDVEARMQKRKGDKVK